jgi:hypothetical protein
VPTSHVPERVRRCRPFVPIPFGISSRHALPIVRRLPLDSVACSATSARKEARQVADTAAVADAATPLHANRVARFSALRRRLTDRSRHVAATTSGALVLSLVMFPAVLQPAPALASSCGTNWSSRATPPQTIRVYLADRHRVVVKNFKTYVAMVMASGEWPSRLPSAVLEAGATAVKQYAWYYALEGNHRPDYRTSGGVCYDVRNDTRDQLFKTVAHPTEKQLRAVDATWDLTLRKGNSFFLTAYRAGSTSRCGADANGWRLYARSAIACAHLGWSGEHILSYYYAPRIRMAWNGDVGGRADRDHTPPRVKAPRVTPAHVQPGRGEVAVSVQWSASDSSGIASYQVQERVGSGPWHKVRLSGRRSTAATVATSPHANVQFRVRAKDTKHNQSKWVEGPSISPQVVQSGAASLSGPWKTTANKHALGESLMVASAAGPTARLTFTGSSIGMVASRGPGRGTVKILVDGRVAGTVDLDARREKNRKVVFTQTFRGSGTHTISVQSMATKTRPIVDVDAFIVIR